MIALALALALQSGTDTKADIAQFQMLDRIERAATAYRVKLGLSKRYQDYCQIRVNVASKELSDAPGYPRDWTKVKDRKELDQAIAVAETFELTTFELCLADAKRTFAEAGQRP